VVGIENNRDVAAKLDADEKDDVQIMDAIGRIQCVTIVSPVLAWPSENSIIGRIWPCLSR
jgi:hypothetical protein